VVRVVYARESFVRFHYDVRVGIFRDLENVIVALLLLRRGSP